MFSCIGLDHCDHHSSIHYKPNVRQGPILHWSVHALSIGRGPSSKNRTHSFCMWSFISHTQTPNQIKSNKIKIIFMNLVTTVLMMILLLSKWILSKRCILRQLIKWRVFVMTSWFGMFLIFSNFVRGCSRLVNHD